MTTLPTIAMWTVLAMVGQDPGEIPIGWGDKPAKAPDIKDPDAEAAEENRRRVALAAAERLGADRLQTAVPLADLGTFYLTRKRYDQAEPLLRRSLAIREAHLPPDHPDVASSLYLLGACRAVAERKGDKTAGPMLRRALAIYEKIAPNGSEIVQVRHLLALDHIFRKKYEEAETELTRAVAIEEKRGGPDSEDLASLLDDLGDLLMARAQSSTFADIDADMAGKPEAESPSDRFARKAEDAYTRALAIREKVLAPDDPHIAETLFNLGQFYNFRDRPVEAELDLQRWLAHPAIAKEPVTEKHAKVYFMLAEASKARKDWAEADRRLSRAEEIVRKVHGADSEEVQVAISSRADLAIDAGWFDVAEKFLREMLEYQASKLGARDPDIAEVRNLMAGGYRTHLDDRRTPILWHRLHILSERALFKRHDIRLMSLMDGYEKLLRRSSRVLPPPTAEDVAVLTKVGVVPTEANTDILEVIDTIFDNELKAEAIPHLARLYRLVSLDLGRLATDEGLVYLAPLVNLRHLDLADSSITDAGLARLAGLEELRELNLSRTGITDAGLAHLKGLRKLRFLQLNSTRITDAGLSTLQSMPGLQSLSLGNTRVTPVGHARLSQARPNLILFYRSPDEATEPMLTVPTTVPNQP